MSNAIPAKLVMTLRERTGSAMMECKKFLIASNGDIEAAIVKMREAGQAKADKKADRLAAEGVVVLAVNKNATDAVMVEINSETDFVARDASFVEFSEAVVETLLQTPCADVEALKAAPLIKAKTSVEEARQQLVAKIGENIQLRRLASLTSTGGIGIYRHGSRIGVMVSLAKADPELAKDMAMHIAASKPIVVNPNEVSEALIASERAIYETQAKETGKPAAIIEKMIDGRVQKFLNEVSLIGQPFLKNPEITVEKWLKEKNNQVVAFVRFQVGEGIEKKQDNFVAEVMAQVKG